MCVSVGFKTGRNHYVLRRMTMKKVIALLIVEFIAIAGAYADDYVQGSNINQTLADLQQLMQGLGYAHSDGGEAVATLSAAIPCPLW
jgi:hypothetical protein